MKDLASPLIERAFGKSRKHRAFRAAVFAVILLPTMAIMALSFFLLRDALTARETARRQTAIERDKLFAHAIAHGISIYLESAQDAVKTAAAGAAQRPMTRDGMRSLLTDMVGNTRAFFAGTVADAAGQTVLVYDPNGATEEDRYRSGFDLSERAYYKELLATKRPVVSDAITSLVSPQPTVAAAAPILDARGEVAGFVAGGVSLAPLYQLALAELGPEVAVPVILDKQGQAIAHPDPSVIDAHEDLSRLEPAARALRGEEGFIDAFTDIDGRQRSAAYAPVAGSGWAVWVAQEPPTDAAIFIREELQRTVIFYGLILLLNLVLAAAIWRLLRSLFKMHEKERAFLESIGDGVIAVDRAWKIILWNRTASQLTGWAEKDVMGRPFREHVRFVRERDRKENLAFIEEAMLFGEIRPMANSTILVTRDGREIPISDSASPLFDEDGTVNGVIIIFRDATREKDAAMLRTDFAYASHQLRTPVNKAMWDIELALDEAKDPTFREKLQTAYHAIRDVQKLSSRLIEVSQIDQKQIVPEYEDVRIAS
ncbi:MAG TPA: cache domain-containing protein, partial [Candidatus Baltobacteraceae bacterium]|nr:cache domain-containing protein [Candidatus Baltobacteraceae bacterium]